ncbi:MAG: TrmB family transcriptional regulator [Candidatus Woesearchaeota archaeon]
MILSKDFIQKLSQLGLNSYEAKLWTALLSQGVSTAGELSDIANVPRSRSYDVLESLEKKGFIIQKLGKPIKYVALPPEEVLERVKKQIRQEAEIQTKKMEGLKGTDILQELTTLHTQGVEMVEPTDLSGSLRSREGIYDHLSLLIKEAEKEILIMSSPEGLRRKLDYLETELEKASQRGVQIKAIISGEITNAPEFINVHVTEKIRARFMIADGKEMVFMLLPDQEVHPAYDVGIWVNTPYFAQAITDVFDIAFPALKTSH